MTKKLFLVAVAFFTLGLASQASAQTQTQVGQYFQWEHDGIRLDHFEFNIDFVEWLNLGKVRQYQIPPMSPSLHTAYVRACATADSTKCSDPLSVQFVIIDPTVPNMPTNMRIVIAIGPGSPQVAEPSRLPSPQPQPARKR